MARLKKAPLPGKLSINQLTIAPLVRDGVTSNISQIQSSASVFSTSAPEIPVQVAITVGNPTVITLTTTAGESGGTLTDNTHFLKPNQAFYFTVSVNGSLPSGITAHTFYYVMAANMTATTFTFSATNNYAVGIGEGAAVATTGAVVGTVSIVLTGRDLNISIPPGPYFCGNFGDSGANIFVTPNGCSRVRYHAYGAIFDTKVNLGPNNFGMADAKTWASQVFDYVNTTPNELATHDLDATVTLQTIANAANYYIGQWISVFGLDLQNTLNHYASGPPNNHYQEYKRIKSINLNTGVLTLEGPLKWVYLSTFPNYFNSAGRIGGGPAVIAQMHPSWDTEVEIRGARWIGQSTETSARIIDFVDCVWQGYGNAPGLVFPSSAQAYRFKNCRFGPAGGSLSTQIDKMFEYLEYDSCSAPHAFSFAFPSPSLQECLIKKHNGGSVLGTPRKIRISESILQTLELGPPIGVTDTAVIVNNRMTYFDMQKRNDDPTISVNNNSTLVPNWTFSNGTFTRNITGLPTFMNFGWVIPGAKMYFIDASGTYTYKQNMGSPFAILNTYMDGSGNLSIDTTLSAIPTLQVSTTVTITIANPGVATGVALANGTPVCFTTTGSLPTGLSVSTVYYVVNTSGSTFEVAATLNGAAINTTGSQSGTHTAFSNPLCFRPHPCPSFTGIGNSGCNTISDLNGAIDEPLFSRAKRSFVGKQYPTNPAAFQQPSPPIWGKMDDSKNGMTVNVYRAGTAGTLTISCPGFTQPNLALSTFSQVIDLTQAGKRTVTSAATTGSAGGDSIAAYADWVAGPLIFTFASTSATFANNAVVGFEMYTDQGLTKFSNMMGAPSSPASNSFVWQWNDSGIIQQFGTSP